MGHLLYSSSEMFSSTELIRKSKMIFDKLLSDEIQKAIIFSPYGSDIIPLIPPDKINQVLILFPNDGTMQSNINAVTGSAVVRKKSGATAAISPEKPGTFGERRTRSARSQ
jgi:hypothetical protein